ncbi:MAG TPA: SDR family oxidoreductase [Patescibacteria group bacterium]|nr:SDR family oxidoreductase [Patescibacteria group bacterium]
MKTIVTGGAGFIGSHLAERLVQEGHQVTVLDNLSCGRLDNLKAVEAHKNFSFVKADISQPEAIAKHFKGVDWVFHLAALADIIPSIVDPHTYHRSNVDGTIAVLEACRLQGVKKFLYTASSSCYGIPKAYPTSESAEILPQYPYAFTKYIGELYALAWAKVYKMPVISLRLFNVYGPRSRTSGTYGAVIGVFLAQKLAQAPFTIVGDGTQTRDFVYVSDVAEAFITAAASDIQGEVFNVGSGSPQSVNTLASLLGPHPAVHIPKRPAEPDCTWADIAKITRMLGWKPKVSFSEGVKQVLAHIDYWKNAPVWTAEKIDQATKDWFKYLSV